MTNGRTSLLPGLDEAGKVIRATSLCREPWDSQTMPAAPPVAPPPATGIRVSRAGSTVKFAASAMNIIMIMAVHIQQYAIMLFSHTIRVLLSVKQS